MSAVRLQLSEKQFYECRFADSIITDYAYLLITCERIAPVVENTDITERLADITGLEDL